jgi:hypothetical protein
MNIEKPKYKEELKCYVCNEMVYRMTTASVYADLTDHYKNAHGLSMDMVQALRKKKRFPGITKEIAQKIDDMSKKA